MKFSVLIPVDNGAGHLAEIKAHASDAQLF
jgi:hypothetical protein